MLTYMYLDLVTDNLTRANDSVKACFQSSRYSRGLFNVEIRACKNYQDVLFLK